LLAPEGEASVLVCFWSPKGGAGTSVVTAGAAALIARRTPVRVVDLDGDLPAIFGLANDPELGVCDWLRAGATAPADALDHLQVEVAPNLALLPTGRRDLDDVLPENGAALAVALRESVPTLCDAGRIAHPALGALAEIADANIIVVRGCYLALRRAIHHPATAFATGVILIDERGRSLGARDIEDVLGVPVLASIEANASIARAADAGVLSSRVPDALAKPLRHALVRIGCLDRRRAA
jgi:hypothetical protein